MVRLVEAVIAARQPTARFIPPAPSVVVDTDPRRLERILGNFLDNAREHAGAADVTVDLAVDRENLVVAVSDRGPGVPEDRLQRIFDRFTKLDPSRSGGSSGLGLAIAAEHAALLGGYLQAMNREGGGLRLELVVPLPVTRSLPGGHDPVTRGYERWTPTPTTRESEP
jgi:two-component system sensor histidine kinase MtrB